MAGADAQAPVWQAWLSQNLFPIAFSRNGISEMEKRDGRAFPKRPVSRSHIDQTNGNVGTKAAISSSSSRT
jgi:hypothetical protein